jgi:hypothetical protein
MTENNMTGLLLQMADLGITGLYIYYSGGGDSGAIEYIDYTTEPVNDYNVIHYQKRQNLKDVGRDIYQNIEDFASEKILSDIEDWWNNDGGYGVMIIKIPSGEYEIANTIYVTDTEEFEHDGDLISKSLE